jgi:hypothetical protein
MGKQTPPIDEAVSDSAGETELRGIGLSGSEQQVAVDHLEHERRRNPDTELNLDGESDDLYEDGIDIKGDFDTPAGTRGSSGTIP